MIWQIIGAFIAVLGGSIFLEVPKRSILYSALIGAAGWGVFLTFIDTLEIVVATFIAGLVIATLAHIASRIFKIPVTVFFIPGVFPLVPGLSMYLAVYNFIKGSGHGQFYLEQAIKISGMIALAIFTIDTIFNVISIIQKLKSEKKRANVVHK